jgi:two-component system response regulator DesR
VLSYTPVGMPRRDRRAEFRAVIRLRILDAGASGYLRTVSPSEALLDAIRHVRTGGCDIDPEPAWEAWIGQDPLSDREGEVLRLAAKGRPGTAIAEELFLSARPVRTCLSAAIVKLQAANGHDAACIARERGWLGRGLRSPEPRRSAAHAAVLPA